MISLKTGAVGFSCDIFRCYRKQGPSLISPDMDEIFVVNNPFHKSTSYECFLNSQKMLRKWNCLFCSMLETFTGPIKLLNRKTTQKQNKVY